jgi:two-component system phosphate regulon sensor histidine kinase PhoR
MRRKPLTWRLLPAFLVITLATLITVTWYTAKSWHQFYLRQLAEDLETRARLVGAQIQNSPILGEEPSIQVLCRDLGKLTATRLTLILSSGKVVGDSDEDPVRMDNHGDRPEFQEAMKGQVGTAIRFSFTLKHDMMYVAVPLKKQDQVAAVVRASLPMKAIDLA